MIAILRIYVLALVLSPFYALFLKKLKSFFFFYLSGGDVAGLDFRFGGIGAPFNGLKAFATTGQLDLGR